MGYLLFALDRALPAAGAVARAASSRSVHHVTQPRAVVPAALLAAAPSRCLAGEAAGLSRLLPGGPQRPSAGKGPPHHSRRGARRVSPDPSTPDPEKSLI